MSIETLEYNELMYVNSSDNNLKEGLSDLLERKLEKYFFSHDGGEIPPGLYDRVLNEVERAVFKVTLKYFDGNQTQASKVLGINRNTLRKKMQKLNVEDIDS